MMAGWKHIVITIDDAKVTVLSLTRFLRPFSLNSSGNPDLGTVATLNLSEPGNERRERAFQTVSMLDGKG